MIEARATAVSGRRYLALLIDSALVAAVGFAVAYLQSEAFAIVSRDDTGDALIDPAEFDRMEELLEFELFGQSEILGISLVRAQEIGDSVRVFGADSYRWGFLAAALASLVVFCAVPAVIQRTIGMFPFGLEIRDIEGGRATTGAHLKRSAAGVIDMIPGIVPGFVGLVVASYSSHQQRIGDRIAATVVVDRKLADFHTSEPRTAPLTLTVEKEIAEEPAGIAAEQAATEPTAPEEALDLTFLAHRSVESSLDESVSTEATSTHPTGTDPAVRSERIDAVDEAPTETGSEPSHVRAVDDAPLPPPPVHRQPPSERPAPFESGEQNDGDTVRLPLSLAPTAPSPATVDDAWEQPRVEPAPVWQPSKLDPAPVRALAEDTRSVDDVLAGEPTVGELISADPVTPKRLPRAEDHKVQSSPDAGRRSTSAQTPVWSDKWRAWMYWDPGKKRWLRHDTSSNTWVPAE